MFGIAILAAVFAAHGSYATPATFISGFKPAEWVAAAVAAAGVIAAALAPSKSELIHPASPVPELVTASSPAQRSG